MDQLGLIDSVSEAQLGPMENSIYENFFCRCRCGEEEVLQIWNDFLEGEWEIGWC